MPTKDELEQENEQLRARVAELEKGAAAPGTMHNTTPPAPKRPGYLSAGEADDLRNAGVTTCPFNGEELNALDEGIEPGNPEARRNAEAAQKRKAAAAAAAA